MEKNLKMDCEEAIEYVKNNVKTYDNLELSYNKIYTPGEVINVVIECLKGKETCSVMVQLAGDTINSTVEVDLEEVKDDLVEVKHTPKDKDDTTVITIDRCDE
jgi:hypothetical protein